MKNHYYFISYQFNNSKGSGFGITWMYSIKRELHIPDAIRSISEEVDSKNVVIMSINEVTKRQYFEVNPNEKYH